MTLKQIASLGRELVRFLTLFAACFRSRPGFALLRIYVQGLLLDLQRKNIEAMALELGKPPRTLQRFVESIKWDEAGVRGRMPAVGCSATRSPRGHRLRGRIGNGQEWHAHRRHAHGNGWEVVARWTMA